MTDPTTAQTDPDGPADPGRDGVSPDGQPVTATEDPARPNPVPETQPAGATDTGGTREDIGPQDFDAEVADTDEAEVVDDDEPIDWAARADQDGRSPAELLAALTGAEVERDNYLDGFRRKQAEFDNFRKRMARDAQSQRRAGQADVALRLLEVLDDFDRTLTAVAADEGTRKGVELVRDKLLGALAGAGLERMEAAGEPFDPNHHEAVQQVPGDGGQPTVTEVLRPGYMMHDRVLRAAMVVVAQ